MACGASVTSTQYKPFAYTVIHRNCDPVTLLYSTVQLVMAKDTDHARICIIRNLLQTRDYPSITVDPETLENLEIVIHPF